jgi:hypothetical protein
MKGEKTARGRIITRRDFLRGTAYGTLGIALGFKGLDCLTRATDTAAPFAAENALSKVVLVRSEEGVDENHKINAEAVVTMIDRAVSTLAGEQDVIKAWGRYIHAKDTVGVKYSRCTWMKIPTEQAVVDPRKTRRYWSSKEANLSKGLPNAS